jgi:periplasmic copper chaperone A
MRMPVLPLLGLMLFGPYVGAAETSLSVHNAWIREAPPGATTLAGYMVIENDGAAPRRLISAASTAFEAVELHRSVVKDGLARMARQDVLSIPPAGGQVTLRPGGYHLMLLNPTRPLRAGDQVAVVLNFDGDEALRVQLPIRRSGGGDHQHHHH